MLWVAGVTKTYEARSILRGVDLEVAPGQVVGVVGANGAGKSTLISIMTGLRRPDAGTVTIAGIDVAAHPRLAARYIGLAPQELGIYPTLTVRENLDGFARLAGVIGRQGRVRVSEVAELLGLTDQLGQRAERLSGGQKRRLHTGIAILHRPALLFLDEPTVGADVTSRAAILHIVMALAAEGTAVVYTTHYLTELEQLNADIAVLDGGVITVRSTCREVIDRWAAASVRLRFTNRAPQLAGWTQEGTDLVPARPVSDPGAVAAHALAALGEHTQHLTGVDVIRPSLESAYLAITGHTSSGEFAHDLAA